MVARILRWFALAATLPYAAFVCLLSQALGQAPHFSLVTLGQELWPFFQLWLAVVLPLLVAAESFDRNLRTPPAPESHGI